MKYASLPIYIRFQFLNKKTIEHFFHPYSTMASNQQRQEQSKLALIRKAKLKGAHEHSKNLWFVNAYNPNAKPTKNGPRVRNSHIIWP
jgi:hypothetical protein